MTVATQPAGSASGAAPPPAPWTASLTRLLPAVLPGVLMSAAGLAGATRPVLSWDEIATADVAGRSTAQIWHLAHHIDGVFVPYYLFMHCWTTVAGDSVLALRLPSIVAMAAAVAVTGELGRRHFGPVPGVVAGILLCLVPNLSRYAAEARPYAIACLFATLSLLLLYRAAERPAVARWAAYGAAVLGLGLAHVVGLLTLAAHLPILVLRRGDRPARTSLIAWGGAVLVALILVSPLSWWGLRQRSTQLDWVPPVTTGAVFTFPARLAGGTETAWVLAGLVLAAAARPRRAVTEMSLAVAVPLAALCAVSVAGPSFWVVRYVLYVLMPAAVVAAAGLVQAGRGLRRPAAVARLLVVIAVVAGTAVPGQRAVRRPTVKNGSDYRTLAAIVRAREAPGDVIVYQPGRTMRTGVSYYLRADAGAPRDVLRSRSAAEMASLNAREYPDPAARLATANRIWLVVFGRRSDPATGRRDVMTLLGSRYVRAATWQVKWATMALYVRRG